MKTKYLSPEIQFVVLTEDVIRTSGIFDSETNDNLFWDSYSTYFDGND